METKQKHVNIIFKILGQVPLVAQDPLEGQKTPYWLVWGTIQQGGIPTPTYFYADKQLISNNGRVDFLLLIQDVVIVTNTIAYITRANTILHDAVPISLEAEREAPPSNTPTITPETVAAIFRQIGTTL